MFVPYTHIIIASLPIFLVIDQKLFQLVHRETIHSSCAPKILAMVPTRSQVFGNMIEKLHPTVVRPSPRVKNNVEIYHTKEIVMDIKVKE